MIRCPKCKSANWKLTYKCPMNPANDTYDCKACKHVFKRYDSPLEKN